MRRGRILKLSLTQKRALMLYVFALPFMLGFVFLFLKPFIESFVFSLSELEIGREGYSRTPVGLDNYRYILRSHPTFVRVFLGAVVRMVTDVPLILVFSLFVAILLNQRFRGRLAVRAVFFLPVILGSGIIQRMELTDYMVRVLNTGSETSGFFDQQSLQDLLRQLRLPVGALDYLIAAAERIPLIVRSSGVQILVFLAGLQSVPSALFEAAEVEGATSWERFWLVTLPILSPLIMANLVYTVIDSFTAADNALIQLIHDTAFGGAGYCTGIAMSLLYFAAVTVVLALVVAMVSRRVFYHE